MAKRALRRRHHRQRRGRRDARLDTLAPSGKRILLLERGDYLPRERDNWDPTRSSSRASTSTDEDVVRRRRRRRSSPQRALLRRRQHEVLRGRARSGCVREDFGEIKHHDGISPAWPLGYEDFEPWYTEAERLYQVHGKRGRGPDRRPPERHYPYPAVSHEPRIQQLHDDSAKPACTRSTCPCGVLLDQDADGDAAHGSTCIRCDLVRRLPVPRGRQGRCQDCVRRSGARRDPNVDARHQCRGSTELETDASGRQVTAWSSPRWPTAPRRGSRGTSSWCRAARSTRRCSCLRSANDQHPNGLANGSDQVGRNYMRHNNMALMALSREPNPTRFQKTLALNEWYFKGDDWDYPFGGIQMLGKSDGIQLRAMAPRRVKWGAKLTPEMSLDEIARHGVDFWLSAEDLPLPDNRLTIDDDGTPRLTLADENNMEPLKRLRKKFESMLSDLGMEEGTHRRNVYLHEGMAISATHTRPAPPGSGGIPPRRCSTSTARPTSSTTSMSSTRASSSRSAP